MSERKSIVLSKRGINELVFIILEFNTSNPYKDSVIKQVASDHQEEKDKYLGKTVFTIIESYGDEFGFVEGINKILNKNQTPSKTAQEAF